MLPESHLMVSFGCSVFLQCERHIKSVDIDYGWQNDKTIFFLLFLKLSNIYLFFWFGFVRFCSNCFTKLSIVERGFFLSLKVEVHSKGTRISVPSRLIIFCVSQRSPCNFLISSDWKAAIITSSTYYDIWGEPVFTYYENLYAHSFLILIRNYSKFHLPYLWGKPVFTLPTCGVLMKTCAHTPFWNWSINTSIHLE
jgi:hypothetical protein